jgi:valyl-tRNA synthetase
MSLLLRRRAAPPLRVAWGLRRALSSSAESALALPPEIHRRVRELPLEATYDPAAVEAGWHEYWQRAIAYKKQRGGEQRAPHFSMLLPPPNVTGALHIGHALTITIQDALARWHHMRGFDVRWVPGLDHAGIATQSVVERKLAQEEGVSKHDLGRDAFLDRVWQWNEQYGGRILHQIDQLGAVVNKDESFFTLDEPRCVRGLEIVYATVEGD